MFFMCHEGMMTDNNRKIIPWELILKRLKNTIDRDENERLAAWIETDDRHRHLWNELQQAWNDIRELNADFNPDRSLAWKRIVDKTKRHYAKKARFIPAYWHVAAACVLVLLGVAIGSHFQSSIEPLPTAYIQYYTQYGKSFLTLPDGTRVWLNARTNLKLSNRFNESERQVRIDGEALFEVTNNRDVPFIVDMKDMQIKVHGTIFNVNAYDDKPEATVSLIEGSVSLVATGCAGMLLEPGFSATYHRANQRLFTNQSDEFVILWANKELRIEDKSLEETARLLEGWYHLKIEVAPALKSMHHFTLTVRHESPAELLAAMQKIAKFQYKIEEQKIVIY